MAVRLVWISILATALTGALADERRSQMQPAATSVPEGTEPAPTLDLGVGTPEPSATATIDRLAPPPTVENPSQADEGAQLYWLHCQPCHGDRAQGLTDEWRAQYPPEDQNCWQSGCHGRRPYEQGFTLPDTVPPLVGEGSLARFATMAGVFSYMRAAMPFQDPGHLSVEEYLAITAFLARGHDLWDGRTLNAQNADRLRLQPEIATVAEATPEPSASIRAQVAPTANIESSPPSSEAAGESGWLLTAGALAIFITLGSAWLWRRTRK